MEKQSGRPNPQKSPAKKESDQPIVFRPITDGLGFHPFSDGLPYAPVSKAGQKPARLPTTGTGATLAGPVQVAPQIKLPTRPTAARVSVPIAAQTAFPPMAAGRPQPVQAQPVQKQPEKLLVAEPEFGTGYLIKRAIAYILDTALNISFCAAALSAVLWRQDINPNLMLNPSVVLVAGLFLALFNWALITAQELAFGTSIGKRAFGLVLRGSATAILFRAFFYIPSALFFGMGVFWALVDGQRRGWHDLITKLQPIEIARL